MSVDKELIVTEDIVLPIASRSFSEPDLNHCMNAMDKADMEGDMSLPLIKGKHTDLKAISPETLSVLMRGHFRDIISSYLIVDCRFPYEFDGGHIKGALNIHTEDELISKFFGENAVTKVNNNNIPAGHNNIIIFHCEFSSKRGPKLCRLMRQRDRMANEYPHLSFPELYILEGGYNNFFTQFKDLCEPQLYTTMDSNQEELKKYSFRKSKQPTMDTQFRRIRRPYTCVAPKQMFQ